MSFHDLPLERRNMVHVAATEEAKGRYVRSREALAPSSDYDICGIITRRAPSQRIHHRVHSKLGNIAALLVRVLGHEQSFSALPELLNDLSELYALEHCRVEFGARCCAGHMSYLGRASLIDDFACELLGDEWRGITLGCPIETTYKRDEPPGVICRLQNFEKERWEKLQHDQAESGDDEKSDDETDECDYERGHEDDFWDEAA
ncbi:hypothetical protein KVT40_007865 [Elsinoe batatas]|uniref:Uncharacterized protein n=1 Tax=Elsinoe batatas TaxID=2601811 RepID=A0A8K0KY90_9PEZI|nr:hypothetical protein KVT40_007865 [Elsinoe batatas]